MKLLLLFSHFIALLFVPHVLFRYCKNVEDLLKSLALDHMPPNLSSLDKKSGIKIAVSEIAEPKPHDWWP